MLYLFISISCVHSFLLFYLIKSVTATYVILLQIYALPHQSHDINVFCKCCVSV